MSHLAADKDAPMSTLPTISSAPRGLVIVAIGLAGWVGMLVIGMLVLRGWDLLLAFAG